MKKLLFAIQMFALCCFVGMAVSSCKEGKVQQEALLQDSVPTDSAATDTLEYTVDEFIMPDAADELFDDFIFNFAENKRLQLSRIEFPLQVHTGSSTMEIQKRQWKMERFFMRQDYYTLIFDDEKQMEIMKDTAVNHVILEQIALEQGDIKQFVFERKQGKWMMTTAKNSTISSSPNASFLKFYTEFVADPDFRLASINNPVHFSGPDPEDDFSTMEGLILPEQWQSFAPELPSDVIYNIIYGEPNINTKQKIFVIRGIANGMETVMNFRFRNGKWKLMRLSM